LREHAPVVWWATAIEVRSALERLRFERIITEKAYSVSKEALAELLGSWREIQPVELVRNLACLQLERFRLRASDALQLSAALVWCKQKPKARPFICNDEKLLTAARHVGFDVLKV
jgi:hypothetical protein